MKNYLKDIIEVVKRYMHKVEPIEVFNTSLNGQLVTIKIYMTLNSYFKGYQYGKNIDLYIPVDFFNYGKSLTEVYLHELIHIKQWYEKPLRHTFKTNKYLFTSEVEAYINSVLLLKKSTTNEYEQAIKDLYYNLEIERSSVEYPDIKRDYYNSLKASIPNQTKNFYETFNKGLKKLSQKQIKHQEILELEYNIQALYSE